jgi:hypothetical protein
MEDIPEEESADLGNDRVVAPQTGIVLTEQMTTELDLTLEVISDRKQKFAAAVAKLASFNL